MRVGDSLELPYDLAGSIAAGEYQLYVQGYQGADDAVVRADLLQRRAGAGDTTLASVTSSVAANAVDGGFPGDYRATLDAPAVNANCGDQLVLRLTLESGSIAYQYIEATLTIP